eukprot:367758-Hanusia_phi.AAC.1
MLTVRQAARFSESDSGTSSRGLPGFRTSELRKFPSSAQKKFRVPTVNTAAGAWHTGYRTVVRRPRIIVVGPDDP